MSNTQTTNAFNSAYGLREKLKDNLLKLKKARADIDAQIMDTCISIMGSERMMDTLQPHLDTPEPSLNQDELEEQINKAVGEINGAS